MITVVIRDFQAIDKAMLEFVPGINVLTGSTNSGKTAVLRAIKCLVDNPKAAKHMIRHMAPKAIVAMKLDGHEPVVWTRDQGTVSYKVGTQEHTKCGKIKLADLVPTFPIRMESDGRWINFHCENDILFPFDCNPMELFAVFERIFRFDNSREILKAIRVDQEVRCVAEQEGRLKITAAAAKILAIDSLTTAESSIGPERGGRSIPTSSDVGVDAASIVVMKNADTTNTIPANSSTKEKQNHQIRDRELTNSITVIPVKGDSLLVQSKRHLVNLETVMTEAVTLKQLVEKAEKAEITLNILVSIPKPKNFANLPTSFSEWRRLETLRNKAECLESSLVSLRSESPKHFDWNVCVEANKISKKVAEATKLISDLKALDVLEADTHKKLEDLRSELGKAGISAVQQLLGDGIESVRFELKNLDYCPLCESPLHADGSCSA